MKTTPWIITLSVASIISLFAFNSAMALGQGGGTPPTPPAPVANTSVLCVISSPDAAPEKAIKVTAIAKGEKNGTGTLDNSHDPKGLAKPTKAEDVKKKTEELCKLGCKGGKNKVQPTGGQAWEIDCPKPVSTGSMFNGDGLLESLTNGGILN
jgi:hypothetical protein